MHSFTLKFPFLSPLRHPLSISAVLQSRKLQDICFVTDSVFFSKNPGEKVKYDDRCCESTSILCHNFVQCSHLLKLLSQSILSHHFKFVLENIILYVEQHRCIYCTCGTAVTVIGLPQQYNGLSIKITGESYLWGSLYHVLCFQKNYKQVVYELQFVTMSH